MLVPVTYFLSQIKTSAYKTCCLQVRPKKHEALLQVTTTGLQVDVQIGENVCITCIIFNDSIQTA
jgi:hypothetical protein